MPNKKFKINEKADRFYLIGRVIPQLFVSAVMMSDATANSELIRKHLGSRYSE